MLYVVQMSCGSLQKSQIPPQSDGCQWLLCRSCWWSSGFCLIPASGQCFYCTGLKFLGRGRLQYPFQRHPSNLQKIPIWTAQPGVELIGTQFGLYSQTFQWHTCCSSHWLENWQQEFLADKISAAISLCCSVLRLHDKNSQEDETKGIILDIVIIITAVIDIYFL